MHLTGMDIRDTPPFTELVELDFDAQVNVFIGPNASGKSVLLKQIDAAFNGEVRPDTQHFDWTVGRHIYHPSVITGASRREYHTWNWNAEKNVLLFTSEDWLDSHDGISRKKPTAVYVGPIRVPLPELHDEDTEQDDIDIDTVLSKPFSGANFQVINEKTYQMTDDMFKRYNAEDTPLEERKAHHIFDVAETVLSCIRRICSEIITSQYLRNYVNGLIMENIDFQPFAHFGDVKIHRSMGINTIYKPSFANIRPEDRPNYSKEVGKEPLHPSHLSSGAQTTFLWIYWLAYKLIHYYDFAENWKEKPAILLIDEIENHLHPTWQRRVIPALLEHFPGLQIFATTHSPFVVAGLRAGQVHLLDRELGRRGNRHHNRARHHRLDDGRDSANVHGR